MDIGERQRLYKQAVADLYKDQNVRFSDAFGVSNSAKIVGGALFAFNANFDSYSVASDQVAVHCLLRFPPEDEIYFTIFIKEDLSIFGARLAEMKAAGTSRPRGARDEENGEEDEAEQPARLDATPSPDILTYTNNNKNVKGYVANDGRLYLRNKGYWDTIPSDLTVISKPIEIERILFAIWPPTPSAGRGLLAREFVGYIGRLIGREKVHELPLVWVGASGISPEMRRMPHSMPVEDIERAVAALGGHYPHQQVRRFHAALNFLPDKHFVILSGLSGTGKTQLALKYARAVHGLVDDKEHDPFLFVCPVRPEWTDPTGLTGYDDVLSHRYIVPKFLEAVLVAIAHKDSPVFVVLDEMNLARVEYYFSDVLSAVETREKLELHSSGVPLEGSTGGTVNKELPIPSNLYIVGTINIDETTNPVSDKVLDRAVVIDMSTVDLPGFLGALEKREPGLAAARAACEHHLISAFDIMAEHNLGFGYRVAEEVVRYHAFAADKLGASSVEVTDDLMVQKVLVKLRGSERQRPLLTGLGRVLGGLRRSEAFLARLTADLDEFGSFQASR